MATPKRLGFLTCAEKRDLIASDRLLASSLRKYNCEVQPIVWTEPLPSSSFDLFIVRNTWDYYRQPQEFLRVIGGLPAPVLNAPELICWNTNKKYFFDLERAGVEIVPSLLVEDLSQLRKLPWQDLVVKPTISAGSFCTFRCSALELGAKRVSLAEILQESEILVQPYLPEIVDSGEISLVYCRARGARPVYSHAVIKRAKPGDFRVQADFGGSVDGYSADAALIAWGEKVLNCIRDYDWLFARVDLILTAHGPLLGELEVIEPELFFAEDRGDLDLFCKSVVSYL